MIDSLVFTADSSSFKLQKKKIESDKRHFKVVKPDAGSLPDLQWAAATLFCSPLYVCYRVLPEISLAQSICLRDYLWMAPCQ